MATRPLVALGVAALVPAACVGLAGGADLDLPGWRVSWYDGATPALALLGSLVWLVLGRRGDVWGRAGDAFAGLGMLAALAVVWTGGFQEDWVSLRGLSRPTIAIWIGVALVALPPRVRAAPLGARLVGAGVALALGVALWQGAVYADRHELALRIEAPRTNASGRDVIVILVDTLRADALGAHGGGGTPFLDGLARRSVVFERAVAQSPWTAPSVASLMTSLHPSTLDPESHGRGWRHGRRWYRLPASLPRLATRFRDAGYHTAAFIKNPMVASDANQRPGFDVYELVGGDRAELESAAQLVRAATRWGDVVAERRRAGDRVPFLLYLHFLDPHIDYLPPDEFVSEAARTYRGPVDGRASTIHELVKREGGPAPEDVAQMQRLYADEVRYLDGQLAALHIELSRRGLWSDETTVVFVSDHGEQFGEHGSFEHEDLHVENVHVPLWLAAPRLEARRVPQVVRLVDVAPTLLELAGLPPLPHAEGRSLLPLITGEMDSTPAAVSEYGKHSRVTTDRYSLIRETDSVALYDLAADPAEGRDLSESRPEIARELLGHLREHESRAGRRSADVAAPVAPISRETLEALEALGYR